MAFFQKIFTLAVVILRETVGFGWTGFNRAAALTMDLAPELPVELQEHRAEPVGKDGGIGGDCGRHSLTRLTNRPDPPSA